MTRLGWRTPVRTLLLQCVWLSIGQLVVFNSILLLKTRRTKKPADIHSKISKDFNVKTRLATSLGIKDTRMLEKTTAQQSYILRTVKIWNESLPAELRSETVLKIFKAKLKSWVKENVKI